MNAHTVPQRQPYIIDSMHTGSMLNSVTEPPSGIFMTVTKLSTVESAIITALIVSFFISGFFCIFYPSFHSEYTIFLQNLQARRIIDTACAYN
ncbi:unknown [Eubacterium sp. CAG:786]|nr:unknown [Eubacterium sp. CAG:786]